RRNSFLGFYCHSSGRNLVVVLRLILDFALVLAAVGLHILADFAVDSDSYFSSFHSPCSFPSSCQPYQLRYLVHWNLFRFSSIPPSHLSSTPYHIGPYRQSYYGKLSL